MDSVGGTRVLRKGSAAARRYSTKMCSNAYFWSQAGGFTFSTGGFCITGDVWWQVGKFYFLSFKIQRQGKVTPASSSEKQNKVVQDSFVIDPTALGITNIKDMTFLHGYHEPTLLVLYEPMHTWVGWAFFSLLCDDDYCCYYSYCSISSLFSIITRRVPSNKNTCVVSAVSLHLSTGMTGGDTSTSHPVIWSVGMYNPVLFVPSKF